MSSSCRIDIARFARFGAVLLALLAGLGGGRPADAQEAAPAALPALRVCAEPDNLPYSREDQSGFENRIARLLADDLQWPLQYEWLPDRRGFVRKTLGARACDVIIGVPVDDERVLTTRPYYRSSYVFVQRASHARDASALRSFDDDRLPALRVGVQLVGNDLAATPPGYALARHGAVRNVVGFTLYGDGPPARRMVDAVARGELDAALAWGPQAGYFAARATPALELTPAAAPADMDLPFAFSIAMGVRKGDRAMKARLDDFLLRRAADIDRILDAYAVPRLPSTGLERP
ncbi:quinoprotein dehydrogenase-associated probable ABC transporter substrate-binding protein [Variovorax sp. PBL-H6]|uniref:substrate-binding domain-containing protein n=1 Tax=Variovorax sp. PBL-H6 TaxID=434009 RepID=UPI00131932C6|nr:substrate-binding domain-containing protein [Variovorax sp. PBL-H6]VTU39326.1 quinoprotein dehydrogenase-associated probable ABC transporter substrate-binding protein [Variovorax sp. PBL-H6]